MDPLTVGSAIIGVVAVGLHATHLLIEDIERIKDVPETLAAVRQDLQNIEAVLQSLSTALSAQDLGSIDSRQLIQDVRVESAVQACNERCVAFRGTLKKLTTHSTDTDLSRRDQFRIGMFGTKKIDSFRRQLQICKGTLDTALHTANLYVSTLW